MKFLDMMLVIGFMSFGVAVRGTCSEKYPIPTVIPTGVGSTSTSNDDFTKSMTSHK